MHDTHCRSHIIISYYSSCPLLHLPAPSPDEAGTALPLQVLPLDAHTRALQSTLLHVGAVNDSAALAEHSLVVVLPTLNPWRPTIFTLQPQPRNQSPQSLNTQRTQPPLDVPRILHHKMLAFPPQSWWSTLARQLLPVSWNPPPPPVIVSNGNVTLVFVDGQLTALTVNGVQLALSVQILWYTPSDGSEAEDHGQCGGAYILRLGSTGARGPVGAPTLSVVEGDLVTEVHQVWTPWASLVYRCVTMLVLFVINLLPGGELQHLPGEHFWVYIPFTRVPTGHNHYLVHRFSLWTGAATVGVTWTVGPLASDIGREVVVRYRSDLASNDTWFTDANGRGILQRQRNQKHTTDDSGGTTATTNTTMAEPIAGNYYPVTSGIHIQEPGRAELTVSVDRACGTLLLCLLYVEFVLCIVCVCVCRAVPCRVVPTVIWHLPNMIWCWFYKPCAVPTRCHVHGKWRGGGAGASPYTV